MKFHFTISGDVVTVKQNGAEIALVHEANTNPQLNTLRPLTLKDIANILHEWYSYVQPSLQDSAEELLNDQRQKLNNLYNR